MLKGKKAKQPYKFREIPNDHPWRRMINQMPGSKKFTFKLNFNLKTKNMTFLIS